MKEIRISLFAKIFLLVLFVFVNCTVSMWAEDDIKGTRQMRLNDALVEIAKKADIYITVEQVYDGEAFSFPSYVDLDLDESFERDLPKKLSALLGVPIKMMIEDVGGIQVFHIMDKKLYSASGYSLNRQVSNFSFSGTLNGLIEDLSTKVGGFEVSRTTVIRAGVYRPDGTVDSSKLASDHGTMVNVTDIGGTVRSVITQSIPLAGYNRVPWTGMTFTDANGTLNNTSIKLRGKTRTISTSIRWRRSGTGRGR